MRRISFVLALTALSATLQAQTWTIRTPTTTASPSMRRAGAMEFDAPANRMIIYGGVTQTPATILGETWGWNGTLWTLLTAANGQPRWGHKMVRIPAQNRILTFGGRSPSIAGLANDTAQWTGTAWAAVPTPTSPTARFRYGMAFDSDRVRVVLFGGRSAAGTIGDTWEFDGTTWLQITPATNPPPREEMVLAYDATLKRTILFGGYDPDTDTLLGDTWEWNGTDWRDITPTVPTITPRFRAASAYDSIRKRIMLYGGFDGTLISTETWEFSGSSWDLVAAGPGSTFATEMYSGYEATRRRMVTFAGVGSSFNNDTWEWNGVNATTGATSPIVGMYGEACPTSAGDALASATVAPLIGQTYTLEWTNIPDATPFVLVLHGLSLPPPIDLEIIGYSNCSLLVTPDFLDIGVPVAGVASSPFVLPNDLSLVNLAVYSQLVIPDAAAANAVGGTSRAVRAVVGRP